MQIMPKVAMAWVAALVYACIPAHAQQNPPAFAPATTLSDDAIVKAAMRPPGITLDLVNVTPIELVAELNKALGDLMIAGQGSAFAQNTSRGGRIAPGAGATADPGLRFTLKCNNTPLWVVLKLIDKQTPIGVQRDPLKVLVDITLPNVAGRPLPIRGNPMNLITPMPESPALAIRASIFNFSGRPENWNLQLTLLSDPRTRICRALFVPKSVTDNEGKSFEIPGSQAKDIAPSVGEFRQDLALKRPFSNAKTAKVTGEAHVWVVLEEETRVVGELNDNQGKPIEMKGGTVTFRKMGMPPGADPPVVLNSTLTRSTLPGQETWPVEFTTNSNGTIIAGLAGGGGGRISGGGVLAIPNGKLKVNWVLRAKEIVIPFEIPDVAIESQ